MQTSDFERYSEECRKVDDLLWIFNEIMVNGLDNTDVVVVLEDRVSTLYESFEVIDETRGKETKKGVYVYTRNLDHDEELWERSTSSHITECGGVVLFFEV
jgi:hypothetical protein